MLNKEDWMNIQAQLKQGVYIKDIAHKIGVSPKTISRAVKRGGPPSGKRPKARRSKLDPFKPAVDKLLAQEVWNAVVIFRELQQQGYTGGSSILRDNIRPNDRCGKAGPPCVLRLPRASKCKAIGARSRILSPVLPLRCTLASTPWDFPGGFISGVPTARMPNTLTRA